MYLAVTVISFNRPHYLKPTLASLSEQSDKDFDLWFFQEGTHNFITGKQRVRQEVVDNCLDIFCSFEFERSTLHCFPHHFGTAITQQTARETIFNLSYDAIVIVEDDLVLSPTFVENMKMLLLRWPHGPVVGAGRRESATKRNLKIIRSKPFPNLGLGISRDVWDKTAPYFAPYMDLVKTCDYRDRPHDAIRELHKSYGFIRPQSSQDAALDCAFMLAKQAPVTPSVSLLRHIGEQGEHMTPAIQQRMGLNDHDVCFDVLEPDNWPSQAKAYKKFYEHVTGKTDGIEI